MARKIVSGSELQIPPEPSGQPMPQGPQSADGTPRGAARSRVRTVSARTSVRAPRRLRISTPRLVLFAVSGVMLIGVSLYAFNVAEKFLIRDPRFAVRGFAGRDFVAEDAKGTPQQPTLLISGAKHASLRSIESVFASDMGRSTYLVPLADRMTALRTVDWVREASIARVWPDRLVVNVSEREPVAFLTLPSSATAMIDADGVILPPATGNFVLPVLIGPKPSDEVDDRRQAVGRMLSVAEALGDNMKNISEVDVSDRDDVIVSQAYDGRLLKLKLGDRNFAKRYHSFVQTYPDIRQRAPDATVLDLRLETRIIAE